MNTFRTLSILTLLVALFVFPATVVAQGDEPSARQEVSVHVPSVVRLQAPENRTVTIDRSGSGTTSKTQRWGVVSNAIDGAELTLSADPFRNRADRSKTRPARLELTKRSGRNWSVTNASGTSGENGGSATVQAASDGPGHGAFGLTVTFVKHPSAEKRVSGTYTTTVRGTVRKK